METDGTNLVAPAVWRRLSYYRRTARVARFLSQHPDEPFGLERAAAIACMERTSFSRFFSKRIGLTFSEFVSAYRVELAIKEMQERNTPLKEIAHAVGFNCLKTFERSFRKKTGMNPSSFRARHLTTSGIEIESSSDAGS